MKLLKLRANKDTFREVSFNGIGLSIIAGRKERIDTNSRRKTYNSVGKSLMIRLLHLCLGSSQSQEFATKLPDWEFFLDFEIDGVNHTSKRATNDQSKYWIDDQELSRAEFRNFFESHVFGLTTQHKYLSYRGLFSRYIRPSKKSYVRYDHHVEDERDYQELITNSYLLGLDIERVSKKKELKEQTENIEDLKRNFEKDPILTSFFQNQRDVDIDIVDLESKVKGLASRVEGFQVAEDYDNIKKQADSLSNELRRLRNEASSLRNAIQNIGESLQSQADMSRERLVKLYDEARVSFPDRVTKTLEDLEAFNIKLVRDRKKRLTEEARRLRKRLEETEKEMRSLGGEEDMYLSFLSSHGALAEFSALNHQLNELRVQLERLQTYKKLVNEYNNRIEELKIELSKENIATNNYLQEEKQLIDGTIMTFRNLVQEFYENKRAGVEISNNDGNNTLRYNISAKIQDDAGDGINEVKIFCFDWALLTLQRRGNVKFLVHDGRLLADMDPRQRATLFRVAYNDSMAKELQYALSVNEDVLQSIREELTDEEYEEIVEQNIVLELTDESDATKLLGMQIDLDYDD